MPTSINGWTVLDAPPWGDPRARRDVVPGVGTQLWVRREAWPLFAALVRDYHAAIAPVHVSDGYDYRQSRTSGNWSNHASGTAVDINADREGATGTAWTRWWKRRRRNLKAQRIRRRYEIVTWGAWTEIADDPHTAQVEGWGADWADAMHWELKPGTTVADVQRIIAKYGITENGVRMIGDNGRKVKGA